MPHWIVAFRHKLTALLHPYLPKIDHSAHFVYFGAAAIGAHDLYAAVAGLMVFIMVLAWIGNMEV